MTDLNQNMQHSDEITLKELILLIKEYWGVLWGKKWYIVIAGLIGGLIFGFIEHRKPITYTAEMTFMVNEDDGIPIGSAAALLGQFGFGGSSSDYNLDKIVQLSRSRNIAENVLFDAITINNNVDILGNHIIKLYDFDKCVWHKDTLLKGFLFEDVNRQEYSLKENDALKSVFGFLIGSKDKEALYTCNYDEDTGILSIKAKTISDELSMSICMNMYKYLSTFYIKQSTDKQKYTLDILNQKVDSIYTELLATEYALARRMDNSLGFELKANKVKEQELNRKLNILNISYGELIKNRATAEFLLETSKPFFSPIDFPNYPLDKSLKKLKIQILFGGFLGGLLSSIYFILKSIIRKSL